MASNIVRTSLKLYKPQILFTKNFKYSNNINIRYFSKILEPPKKTPNYFIITRTITTPNAAMKFKETDLQSKFDLFKADSILYKRVNWRNLNEIVGSLETSKYSHEEMCFLLECCGNMIPDRTREDKIDLLTKIWNKIEFKSENDYRILLRIYRENLFNLEDFQSFLGNMKSEPNIEIFQDLIYLYCQVGNIPKSMEVLSEMKKLNFPITESVFNALIIGHSKNKDLINCETVFETMNANGVKPSSETYTVILGSYLENLNFEKFEKKLKEFGNLLNEAQLVYLIKIGIFNGSSEKIIVDLVKLLPDETLNNSRISPNLRNIMIELVHSGKVQDALQLINSLPKPEFQPKEDIDIHGSFVINELIKTKTSLDIFMDFCNNLINSGRNTRALHIACELALKTHSDISIELLKKLSEKEKLRPHYFWPVLMSASKRQGEAGVLEILDLIKELKVGLDFQTINFYILPKLSITIKDAKKAIKVLEDHGIKTSQLLTPLTSQLLFQQRFTEILEILPLYQTKIDTDLLVWPLVVSAGSMRTQKNHSIIAKVVKLLIDRSSNQIFDLGGNLMMEIVSHNKMKFDYNNITELLQEYQKSGIKISNLSSEVINQHFQKCNSEEKRKSVETILKTCLDKKMSLPSAELFNNHITHPRDMSLEELECQLIELDSKKLNSRGVLRRILQMCVKEGKLERALEIKKICDSQKVNKSPGMLASILDLYIKTKNVESANRTLNQMKELFPGFPIDEHKLIDFASILIEAGNLEEAKKVLKMKSTSGKKYTGTDTHKNIWNLLSNMAQFASTQPDIPGDQNSTSELLTYLVQLNYCGYHNTLLGPIIREYILRNDLKMAVETYKKFSAKYRKTPLQQELMTLLVKVNNMEEIEIPFNVTKTEAKELLQTVLNTSTKIHGAANANLSLILSVSEGGTENQLRKLLIDPQIRINPELLIKQSEYLSNAGKIEPLMKLAKCCRGLGHLVKEQDLYTVLLNSFVRQNNYQSALSLFEKLTGDDEFKISQEFSKNLVSLLEKNNLEVPTSVAMHVKIYS